MSSTPIDLPIVIAQLPYVQKLANAEQASPETRKSLFGPIIAEHLRRNKQETVQEVEETEAMQPVDSEGHNQQEQQAAPQDRNKKEQEEEETESGASSSPWSGNIVNMKV